MIVNALPRATDKKGPVVAWKLGAGRAGARMLTLRPDNSYVMMACLACRKPR